jgi:hypothetical protein
VQFIDTLVKEAQLYPEDVEPAAQHVPTGNPEYYQLMQALYDKIHEQATPTMSEAALASKKPVSTLAENVPKVVSAPK